MEFTPFKIVIAAIATLALLYIFFVYLSPYFLWPKDAQKQIESAILFATAKPGKAIEAENTVFESETSFSGNTFRAAQLETMFECNSASDCCDKGTECSNTIEWNEASVLFKQKKAIRTFARCESQHNIAACTVYFGQRPAQIKIVSTSALSEMDFSTENTFNIDLLVKNNGSVFAPSVFAKTKLFKLNQQKTTMELVLEKNSGETELGPGEQKLIPINLEIELAANYVAEIRVEGENAGFDENSVEFSVIGTGVSLCKPAGKGETIFDSSTEKCEQNYYCSNCYYAFECKNAWQDAEPEKVFVDADPHHAMEITEPVNGTCAPETTKQTENPGQEEQPTDIRPWKPDSPADPKDVTVN